MLQNIKQKLLENKNLIYTLFAVSLFSGYCFYGRYELARKYDIELKKKKNKLDTTFEELLLANKKENVLKIVFTQADSSSGNYRKMVIDRIKEVFPQKDLGVLINCSPKKLFDVGCESFIQTFDYDDDEYIDYIINFLKQQLLVEDTIQKIDDVSQMNNPNSKRLAIMLCDNNCLDMMRMTTPKGEKISAQIPGLALRKLGIKLVDLFDLYGCVIHFEQDPETETRQQVLENEQIQQLWGKKDFRGFYQKFKYDSKKSKEENVNQVINFLHEQIREYQKERQEFQKENQSKKAN